MSCHRIVRALAITGTSVALVACGSITGLDGTSDYACKAPEGVKCDSVSGTYYNALQNNLPSQRKSSHPAPAAPRSDLLRQTTASGTAPSRAASSWQASPLRASPRVMRLWIKPWEDADRDLNGESLVYVQIDDGRWLVDHVQRQAREAYAPIRPAKATTAGKKQEASEPGRPPGALGDSSPSEDATGLAQAMKALQQRGGSTSPSGEN